ncbi:hypothetical protein G7Y89_g10837 [Cudoniella acicularis]|uniref:cellulase n=1 Tax=Cudoniella acicularis TaxID=354080 RepID=A0A8H4VYU1_9HELO|nr:hypothetical protein G7Y89_g10837 [Cudoniella acicularis]
MRFSTTFLAAGLTASVLAAPIAENDSYGDHDACEWTPPTHPNNRTHHHKGPHDKSFGLGPSSIASISTATVVPVSLSSAGGAAASSTALSTLSTAISVAIPTSLAASSTPAAESTSSVAVAVAAPSTISSQDSLAASTATSSALASSSSAAAVGTSSASTTTSSPIASGKFKFFGVDESGAEFAPTTLPGTLGTTYEWPSTTSIGTLMGKGMNAFRIPFLMERIAPGTITATLDATYLSGLQTVVSFITAKGGYAIIDAHNYGRYDQNIITSTSDFQTFWKNVATEFATNDNVVFDCNNEFNTEANSLVASLNQACIDGVRAAGATTQYIFVEGNAYTGAWTWVSSGNGDAMGNLTDPSDKIIYEMHQYLDTDGSGTHDSCDSATVGADRIAAATAWLKANNKLGVIGEYAGAVDPTCETAITGMLDALAAANDVWMGAIWWGGGALWQSSYLFNFEPPSGQAYTAYIDILTKYV